MTDVASPALQLVAAFGREAATAKTWPVPIEVVLALPSSSIVGAVVRNKMARGERPLALADMLVQGGRFFARVHFVGINRPALLFPLDLWTRAST